MPTALRELAERFDCAVVVIHHANKSQISRAMHRVTGSVDIVAAVRLVHLFGIDPEDEDAGAMNTVKSNIGPCGQTLAYRLEPFKWTGPSNLTVDDLLGPQRANPCLQEATALLQRTLAGGAKRVDEVLAEARAQGVCPASLRRARQQLRVQPNPVYTRGKIDHWVWALQPSITTVYMIMRW